MVLKLVRFIIKKHRNLKDKRKYSIKKKEVWARQLQYLNEFGKSNKKSPCKRCEL